MALTIAQPAKISTGTCDTQESSYKTIEYKLSQRLMGHLCPTTLSGSLHSMAEDVLEPPV